MGLVDGATPIIVKGAFIAYLATGQVFFQAPDLARYRAFAREYGYDEAKYLAAIQAVPVVAEARFRQVLSFLSELATQIAEDGLLRLEKHEQHVKLLDEVIQRGRAEEADRASQELLDKIINAIPIRVFWKDKQSVYLGCNAEFARDAGCAGPADIIGKNDYELPWRDFAHLYRDDDRQVLETGQAKLLIEEPLRKIDGQAITVLTSKLPLRDVQGDICGVLGTYQDISVRKTAEAAVQTSNRQLDTALTELKNTQSQLIAQENLRVLGQMAAGIAHDFNNSLAPIIGFSELLLKHPEKLAEPELVLQRLRVINICANDAARVVRQMREFGRPRAGSDDYQPLDLNKLIQQTIELTQQRWKDQAHVNGHTIHIVTDLLPVPAIAGEEYAIRELLTNLIFNAVEALPAGGTITMGTMVDGQSVRLSVSDTGTGMTAEVQQRCLEPFFTTKGVTGMGLGLAMVQGIVQRHGGTVAIDSAPGQGTTFVIRLPIQPTEQKPAVPLNAPAGLRSLRVLVVDDELQLRAVTEAWLADDGHTVETVASGVAALARLKTGQFDVVITDKAMPAMTGEQLAASIARDFPGLPVILMTGFGDMMIAAGEMPPHFCAILCKPITQASMRAALAKAVPAQLANTPANGMKL